MAFETCLFISQHLICLNSKKTRTLNMLLIGNQKRYVLLNLVRYTLLFSMKKLFGYKIGMQFNNSIYVLRDQNSYVTKIVNVHIVLDLDNCVRTSYNSFTLKIFLFGATIVVKNSDQS